MGFGNPLKLPVTITTYDDGQFHRLNNADGDDLISAGVGDTDCGMNHGDMPKLAMILNAHELLVAACDRLLALCEAVRSDPECTKALYWITEPDMRMARAAIAGATTSEGTR